MTDAQEARLKELEANANRTPQEETLRVALLELDERCEDLDEAKAANPVPDPVKAAQDAVDAAEKAVADAEVAVATPAAA